MNPLDSHAPSGILPSALHSREASAIHRQPSVTGRPADIGHARFDLHDQREGICSVPPETHDKRERMRLLPGFYVRIRPRDQRGDVRMKGTHQPLGRVVLTLG